MPKFKLCEWEDNGHHDSYFYGAYFDDATGTIETTSLGATAYAPAPNPTWEECQPPTPAAIEAARLVLRGKIYPKLREAEDADVLTPQDAAKGDILTLLVPHARQLKAEVPCEKCRAKGFWQNPNNPSDRRPCFSCAGKGTTAKGEALRDAAGKVCRDTIPAGAIIVVIKTTAFGTFYRNGYNRPNRDNRSVTGTLPDGTVVNVPLKKCRCLRDPMTDAALRERADELSRHLNFGAIAGCRAWLSIDYVTRARQAQAQAVA